ncbi:MAG: helix-turn-helix domain-containing protein [Clostridia bacterium]|nr:helix-turn-helix domain-containing protein [Clostridia bacterium]
MDELKETISKNLVQLRDKAHLTQRQLAEMLNYSDKAVSKWERGEAIPDVRVLIQICKIYGITLDELVTKKNVAESAQPEKHINVKRLLITCISAVFVWFIAAVIFLALVFTASTSDMAWMVFVVAPLPMSIVLLVFCVKWWNKVFQGITSSMVLWSCVLIALEFVHQFAPDFKAILWIYLGAGVFEVLLIMWFVLRWFMKSQLPKIKATRQARRKAAGKGTKSAPVKAARTPKASKAPKADLTPDSTDISGGKENAAAKGKDAGGSVKPAAVRKDTGGKDTYAALITKDPDGKDTDAAAWKDADGSEKAGT